MADHRIVQAKKSFATRVNGDRLVIHSGDLFLASDPVVKNQPELFTDLTVRSSNEGRKSTSASAVEEATAAPGGRRRLSRKADESTDDEKDGEV